MKTNQKEEKWKRQRFLVKNEIEIAKILAKIEFTFMDVDEQK